MARRVDQERIQQARRDAIRNVIIQSRGLDPDVAERWCDAWEAEAALRDVKRDGDYLGCGQALDRRPVRRQEAAGIVSLMLRRLGATSRTPRPASRG